MRFSCPSDLEALNTPRTCEQALSISTRKLSSSSSVRGAAPFSSAWERTPAALWWPVGRGSRSHPGGRFPLPVAGTVALRRQVKECLFLFLEHSTLVLAPGPCAPSLWNALHLDLRWQPASQSLAIRPNVTSSGKPSWTTSSETAPKPSPCPLSHYLVSLCSSLTCYLRISI